MDGVEEVLRKGRGRRESLLRRNRRMEGCSSTLIRRLLDGCGRGRDRWGSPVMEWTLKRECENDGQ